METGKKRIHGLLMIGGTSKSSGKTELISRIISNLKDTFPITAIKVTTIAESDRSASLEAFHGKECLSFKGDYKLVEETDAGDNQPKDTARMLRAGARKVYWLRVRREKLASGLKAVMKVIPKKGLSIIESNTFRQVVEPDLFLIVNDSENGNVKPSCREVEGMANGVVSLCGIGFDMNPARIRPIDGEWKLIGGF
jgi:hypothetical protein